MTEYTVSVRNLCEFAAKTGDLDLRFTPSPTAQQGREGHQLVAERRGPDHEAEVSLSGHYQELKVRGRADGYDAKLNILEEIKTFRGAVEAVRPNQRALHWAQLKVYGWLLCESRQLSSVTLNLVYFDVMAQTEHPLSEEHSAGELKEFFESLAQRFLGWARQEMAHRARRDEALAALAFPQAPFRPGQREMAAGVYRACVQSRPLLVQAPTGIGKTLGVIFPALRAMPVRGIDKLFYLSAKTTGRAVALEALQKVAATRTAFPLRVIELVAKDKACEHKDKACHGDSCPLARGFYERLPAAREAAAQHGMLDQSTVRTVALEHGICPYYLSHEMLRWSDVAVGDYNYWFDRSAMLHTLALDNGLRSAVLVDEAHNLHGRACGMYSAGLTHDAAIAVREQLPRVLRGRIDDVLNQWDLLVDAQAREPDAKPWRTLAEIPSAWLKSLQRFNSAVGEHLNDHPADTHGALLPFYFDTLKFATLAEEFGEHSLCEFEQTGRVALRNIVPAHFIASRIKAADSIVLFSATLHPADYYVNLVGLPEETQALDIDSPFSAEQLSVRVASLSTRRDDRADSLDTLVDTIATQYTAKPGNYMAFFSSFDYMEMAEQRLREQHAAIPVWTQQRQMSEPARHAWLQQFDAAGRGIGFAVLGGAFAEGVDLVGTRLIGAFIATLGLPQFDEVNQAIAERLEARFGKGHDYTYVYPGLQKVVQAAGRVIRSASDTGTIVLLDDRYLQQRYRKLLPKWWRLGLSPSPTSTRSDESPTKSRAS